MSDAATFHLPTDEAATPLWRLRTVTVRLDGERRVLRLVRFARGWLASTDTVSGPTLGSDTSPYLAARRALEPLGIGLVEAMSALGGLAGLQHGGEVAGGPSAEDAGVDEATHPVTA